MSKRNFYFEMEEVCVNLQSISPLHTLFIF
jgi:hypothetical protein